MAAAPITVKLRCRSWVQLESIYKRDLARSAIFLRSAKPPPIGTRVRIDLSLPSDSLIVLTGTVSQHIPEGGLGGRGPGIDLALDAVPQSAMWLIETALKSAAAQQSSEPVAPVKSTAPVRAASLEDDADVAEAESDLVAALQAEHDSLLRLNPFQILDVGYDSSDADVRAAFGQLTRKYHPDRFARYQSREARRHASEIFILIRDAYRKIGTEKGRTQTLTLLRTDSATPTRGKRSGAPTAPPPTAGGPDVGVGAVRSGPPATPAFQPLRDAVRPAERSPGSRPLAPERTGPTPARPADAAAPSGPAVKIPAAELLIDAGDYDQALQLYTRAAHANPTDRGARTGVELVEGLRALVRRDRLEAAQRFEAVLELDPTNERAARELAEMRRIATNERKGLLARLLGKKE